MFFDLQFSQAKFLEMLRDQVERALPLVTDPFDSPFGGDPLIIDHLDVTSVGVQGLQSATIPITGPSGPINIAGNKVRIKISLKASLTTRANVIAAGNLQAPSFLPFPLWIKADISANAASGAINLDILPIEVGEDSDSLTAANKQALLGKLPSLNRSIPLPDVAGQALTVTNAGITLNGGVIAISAEISPPNGSTANTWTNFYAGGFMARPGDWSIVLPSQLIVKVANDAITSAVDSFPSSDASLEIISEPASSWAGVGVMSKATLNAVDACPVFSSDISFDLNFFVTFSLENDAIKVTIDVSWDLDDWDVFRCGLATVLLPGAIVTLIAGLAAGPVGAIIAVVATIVALIVAVVVISDKAAGELSSKVNSIDPGSLNLHTVSKDDSHAVIEGSVKIGDLLTGMIPTSVAAVPAGLQIGGTLTVPPHQERSLHLIGQTPFDWDAGYSCSQGQWVVEQIEATLGMTEPANYPILAKVELITQPASNFVPTLTIWAPVTGFSLSVFSKLAANQKPDCEVLIWTNSGVRYCNFGHLPAEPAKPSAQQLIEDKIGCMKFRVQGPEKWLEAHWLVDPPPYDRVIDQLYLWDIVASKVDAGAQVQLAVVGVRGDMHVVAKMPAGANGQAAFRVATTRGQSIAVNAESSMEKLTLFRAGVALEPVAHFVPHSRALNAAISGAGADAHVSIVTADKTLTFGIDGQLLRRTISAPAQRAALTVATGALPASALKQTATVQRLMETATEGRSSAHQSKWLAEPGMKTPIRTGNLAARVEGGAVTVYRYMQTRVF